MERTGGRITDSPGSEFLGLSPEKKRDVEAYLSLIEQAITRRQKEGKAGDGHPDLIANDSPYRELFDPVFRDNPRWTSRYMWGKTLPAYLDTAKEHGIDLLNLENPSWLKEAKHDEDAWIAKTPAERFVAIETDRASALAEQWKSELDNIADGAQCLDVGCGSGFFVTHMREHYPNQQWQGTDIHRDMPTNGTDLDRATTDWFTPATRGKPLPYEDASMDVITLNNVLHHVPQEELAHVLNEVERVLKPGGALLVTEEFAGHRYDKKTGHASEITAAVPEYIDKVFWRDDLGSQKPMQQWQSIVEERVGFGRAGERVVGTFGTPGLPVMESCMRFIKR
ncbi:MAG: class I SAM-dependent methyltransferase [Rickettsiales bacterium]